MAHKELIWLRGYLAGKNLPLSLRALHIAELLHDGQFRKGGDPYIVHPVRVACTLINIGVVDDATIATALLHDVPEDCAVSINDLIEKYGTNPGVAREVHRLTKVSNIPTDKYYQGIKEGLPGTILTKISDRCNNVSTMAGVFTPQKIKEYIAETEQYVLPLCKFARKYYPEHASQIYIMKYQIESLLVATKELVA